MKNVFLQLYILIENTLVQPNVRDVHQKDTQKDDILNERQGFYHLDRSS